MPDGESESKAMGNSESESKAMGNSEWGHAKNPQTQTKQIKKIKGRRNLPTVNMCLWSLH
jgi:hypothetical protein